MYTSQNAPFPSKPLDIMYDNLTPVAISLLASSTNLIQTKTSGASFSTTHAGDDTESVEIKPQSVVLKSIAWCRSFLDVMVWTKLISERAKNHIVGTLIECSALLPALVTLGMPGYFTQYGKKILVNIFLYPEPTLLIPISDSVILPRDNLYQFNCSCC